MITGCRKYEEYLHAAIRRMTRSEWEVIGIVGGGTEASLNEKTRILSLPVEDTYEALPSKIHAAVEWIAANRPGISGIFKTDDDILFDMNSLASAITISHKIPFWGVHVDVCEAGPITGERVESRFINTSLRPTHQAATYCYGLGYWVSKDMFPHICKSKHDYMTSYLEDVCTGFVLNREGIFPTQIEIPYKESPRGPELLAIK